MQTPRRNSSRPITIPFLLFLIRYRDRIIIKILFREEEKNEKKKKRPRRSEDSEEEGIRKIELKILQSLKIQLNQYED